MSINLLLLPGMDGSGILFDSFVSALPAHVVPRVISYPGDQPMSYAELLHYVSEQVPDDQPFAVLGESFSGPLALLLAAANPRVEAVILCASFVVNPLRYVPKFAARFALPFWFHFVPVFAVAKSLLGSYSTPELRASLEKAHAFVTPRVLAFRIQEVIRVDAQSALRDCPAPVLYLGGASDRVVRRHNAASVKKLRPDAEVVFCLRHTCCFRRPLRLRQPKSLDSSREFFLNRETSPPFVYRGRPRPPSISLSSFHPDSMKKGRARTPAVHERRPHPSREIRAVRRSD